MQKNNFSGQDISGMLKIVAQRMGKTPEQLQQELQNGNYQSTGEVKEVLNNKDELQKLLGSPQVQELLKKLKEK